MRVAFRINGEHDAPNSRAFFKDFPVGGGAFFEKGPFCEIKYQRGIAMTEGHVSGQYTTHEWGGGVWGVLPQKNLKLKHGNAISCILRSKFALKFMLTILVFEIKEGKKCTKSKKEY